MSSLDFAKATTAGGQSMSMILPGGSVISFKVKIGKNVAGEQPSLSTDNASSLNYANARGPRTVMAHEFPTYSGAVLGNAYYKDTAGKPALWTTADRIANPDGSTSDWGGWVDHIELTDISVTKNGVPYQEYSLIMADAESTDATGPEALAFTSDKPIQPLFTAQPNGYSPACAGGLTGVGATQVICAGGNDGSGSAGAAVMKATAPSRVAIDMRVASNSREAVAFAVMFTQASGSVTVDNASGNATGTYRMTVRQGDTTLGGATTDGSTKSAGVVPKQPIVAGSEGVVVSYSLSNGGGTPDGAYAVQWVCTVNGAPVTPQLTADGRNASVRAEPNDAVNCDATLVSQGPKTGDASKTINPDQVAELSPSVTPGTGTVTSVAFDNGQTTKVVAGEGSWSISVVDGKPVAKFTPEAGYHGAVTPQVYTVTDSNGLSSNQGSLKVRINTPPVTGDASKTINPDQVANFDELNTVPGNSPIVEAVFDNGQATKVVPGEGTWKLVLDESGKPTATFTPEAGYHGSVTSQAYTVTDQNGLSASGTLNVTIKVPANPTPAPTPSTEPGDSTDNPDNPGGRLPMTGADNVLGLTAGALSLIGLGGAAIMYARKRRGL